VGWKLRGRHPEPDEGREEAKMRRTRRFTRWLERTLLGAAMIVLARVVERRILRAVERRHA
jgi:hypothetical protein